MGMQTNQTSQAGERTRKYIYAVCPHCEHPNIHVEDGKIAVHIINIASSVKCLGSGMEANEQHECPLNRHTSEFMVALQMAQLM